MSANKDLALPGATFERKTSTRRLIVATTIGNAMEFFDLTVFSFFAVLIGKLFFPVHAESAQLLLAVATFGVGFVTRPLGGIVLGIYADRYGRVAAMKLTFLLMALGTGLIGLMPTYAQIGVAAPVLVVIARLLQGVSAGGEVGASTTLLAEQAPPARRGFVTSWQFASQGGAAMVGALVGAWLSHSLSPADLESWGWRLPFLSGMLIAPVGVYLRSQLEEEHTPAVSTPGATNPLWVVLKHYPRMALAAFSLVVGGTATHFIVLYYMSTYAIKVLHLPMSASLLSGSVAGLLMMVLSPLSGLLSDRYGRKPILQASRLALTLLIYPGFVLLNSYPSLSTLLMVIGVLSALHAFNAGASGPLLAEIFPKEARATGMSLAYALAVAIFGGFAQLIVTWLIDTTGNLNSPAWYVIGCGLLAFVAALFVTDRTNQHI